MLNISPVRLVQRVVSLLCNNENCVRIALNMQFAKHCEICVDGNRPSLLALFFARDFLAMA
jgi:hypothetical protein